MAHENPTFSSSEILDEIDEALPELALEIHDAWLTYGKGEQTLGVKGVDLHVPRGAIYALLGPSACGKTTLLSSAVGIRFLKRGTIRVFGLRPGTKESGVPGSWVGYMPQELAMYVELTAEETLSFNGRIHCMSETIRQERTKLLMELLELPPEQRVKQMSGGQQRRLSLAVALIHDPALLILDEPTVGVDPLLRRTIWKHLKDLTAEQGKTIVITTHYIEEAHDAHMIGLMRDGRILLEESPQALLTKYKATSLEEVFLQVCIQEDHLKAEEISISSMNNLEESTTSYTNTENYSNNNIVLKKVDLDKASGSAEVVSAEKSSSEVDSSESWQTAEDGELSSVSELRNENVQNNNLDQNRSENLGKDDCFELYEELADHLCITLKEKELTEKDKEYEMAKYSVSSSTWKKKEKSLVLAEAKYLELSRQRQYEPLPNPNKSFLNNLLIIFAITWKNVILMRRTIVMVIIAFVTPMNNVLLTRMLWGHTPFDLGLIVVNNDLSSVSSKNIIGGLDHRILDIKPQTNFEEAVKMVQNGEAVAALHIPNEFSYNSLKRMQMGLSADNQTIWKSRFHIHMDRTNMITAATVFISVLRSGEKILQQFEKMLATAPGALSLPLKFEQPIVGDPEPEMADVYTMGFLSESVFLTALTFSTLIFLSERNNGMFDRNRVSGLNPVHLVASHSIVQTVVAVVQSSLLLIMLFVIKMDIVGSRVLVLIILLLSGYFGMAMGIVISALTQNSAAALTMAFGFAVVTALCTGFLWPTEAMDHWVQWICFMHPGTLNIRALKLIITRGLGLAHFQIWSSILVSIGWVAFILIVAVVSLTKNATDRIQIKIVV